MKKLVEVTEVEEEGFFAIMGEQILVFCLNYIYTGKLIGVNDTCILLEEPSIVYETGKLNEAGFKDAQKLKEDLYIQMGCIESFGKV